MGQTMQDLKKKGEGMKGEAEKMKGEAEQKGSEMGQNEKMDEAKKKMKI